jgi:hypothetical protein
MPQFWLKNRDFEAKPKAKPKAKSEIGGDDLKRLHNLEKSE